MGAIQSFYWLGVITSAIIITIKTTKKEEKLKSIYFTMEETTGTVFSTIAIILIFLGISAFSWLYVSDQLIKQINKE